MVRARLVAPVLTWLTTSTISFSTRPELLGATPTWKLDWRVPL